MSLKPYSEVGTIPGTYRIIDIYCLKEVLNQIMKCSCGSDSGFSIFQEDQENSRLSFYSILDIMCSNCQRKISFGTSMIFNKADRPDSEPEVDLKLNKIFSEEYQKKLLWSEFYSSPAPETYSETKFRLPESLNTPERGIEPEFIDNTDDPELVLCYGIFESENFSTERKKDPRLTRPIFECDICTKQFSKQYNLKEHSRIHSRNKLVCRAEGCNKTFNDKSSLNKHNRSVHKAEKPHACDKCDKVFSRSGHLQEHMVVHTKEKRFQCSVCNKRFPFLSTMKTHMLIHTGREEFKCDQCQKPFKGKKSLKVHLLNVHKICEFTPPETCYSSLNPSTS